MKRIALLACAAFLSASAGAKSLVLTLNDKAKTRVYFKLDDERTPKMVMNSDGTFTLCGRSYEFAGITSFCVSDADYSGEKNTEDAIVAVSDDACEMQGQVSVYTTDGRLVAKGERQVVVSTLDKGLYILTNGVSTLKIQKR